MEPILCRERAPSPNAGRGALRDSVWAFWLRIVIFPWVIITTWPKNALPFSQYWEKGRKFAKRTFGMRATPSANARRGAFRDSRMGFLVVNYHFSWIIITTWPNNSLSFSQHWEKDRKFALRTFRMRAGIRSTEDFIHAKHTANSHARACTTAGSGTAQGYDHSREKIMGATSRQAVDGLEVPPAGAPWSVYR